MDGLHSATPDVPSPFLRDCNDDLAGDQHRQRLPILTPAADVRAGAPLFPFGIPVFAPGAGLRPRCATTLFRSLHSFL
jgi:hypothetical protein